MRKPFLMLCLAGLTVLAVNARAAVITFDNTQVEATAVAITGDGVPGFDQQQDSSGATVVAMADSVGSDVATAGAIAGLGLLSTSADAAASQFGHAVSTARFGGAFGGSGTVNLWVDLLALDLASGSGAAATTLFISLVSDGVTLFEDFVQDSWSFSFLSTAGASHWLEVILSSEASAAAWLPGDGNASAFGQVTIAGSVPEAATLLLLAVALAALVVFSPRRRPAAAGFNVSAMA